MCMRFNAHVSVCASRCEINFPGIFYSFEISYVPNAKHSDTDDDLPPSHQKRVPRRSHVTGNGRSAVGPVPYLRIHSDMEAEIHHLEQEAYYSVLRAFKAQSNAITWVLLFLPSDVFISFDVCQKILIAPLYVYPSGEGRNDN